MNVYQRVTCELCQRLMPKFSAIANKVVTTMPGDGQERGRFVCTPCKKKVVSLFPSLNVKELIIPADPGKRVVEI